MAALVLVCLAAIDYFAYPYGAWKTGKSLERGENGLWLRYTWYFGLHSDADVTMLGRQLRDRRIRYAWFHVRSIEPDGSLKYRYPDRARRLIKTIHSTVPEVKVIAWIYAGNRRSGEGSVDLAKPEVRARMAAEARWLTEVCGFDGVQWDYEICADSEPGFLSLIRATRASLPHGRLLSVATPVWYPWPMGCLGWSDEYFQAVMKEWDQVVVMAYDTGFWIPRSYAWLVRQQAIHATRDAAAANPACRVLIGIPTYGSGFRSHNPRAENIAIALKGLRDGLADPEAKPATFAGAAPFVDYTTDTNEWETWRRIWLQR